MLGEVFGNYRITGAVASGGMGAVYRGEHTLIGKPAAIKVLLPEWSANHEIVNRFFNEARATTAIRHPGIVEIFDYGHHESGRAYLVMELLNGEPLAARLQQQGRIAEAIATGLIRSIVGALAAAHAAGIVHRDLKPDNVFLVRDPDVPGGERPKLLDFGIAKLADGTPNARATRTGVVLGTPTYMAPEQCRGAGAIDARADLYAIGCIFFEMLTGRPPFVAEGAGELMAAHLMTVPDRVRVHAPDVSPAVDEVIARLLAKHPDARYASANELLIALGGSPQDASGRPLALVTPAMLTPVPVPTTLSGAASQSSPRGTAIGAPRRRALVAVGGAVAATAIAAVAWVGLHGSGEPPIAPAHELAAPARNVEGTPQRSGEPSTTSEALRTAPGAPSTTSEALRTAPEALSTTSGALPTAPKAPSTTSEAVPPAPPPVPTKVGAHHHTPKAKPTTPNPATQPPKPTLPELPPEL